MLTIVLKSTNLRRYLAFVLKEHFGIENLFVEEIPETVKSDSAAVLGIDSNDCPDIAQMDVEVIPDTAQKDGVVIPDIAQMDGVVILETVA